MHHKNFGGRVFSCPFQYTYSSFLSPFESVNFQTILVVKKLTIIVFRFGSGDGKRRGSIAIRRLFRKRALISFWYIQANYTDP